MLHQVLFVLNLIEFNSVEVEFLIAAIKLAPHFFFTWHIGPSIRAVNTIWRGSRRTFS